MFEDGQDGNERGEESKGKDEKGRGGTKSPKNHLKG